MGLSVHTLWQKISYFSCDFRVDMCGVVCSAKIQLQSLQQNGDGNKNHLPLRQFQCTPQPPLFHRTCHSLSLASVRQTVRFLVSAVCKGNLACFSVDVKVHAPTHWYDEWGTGRQGISFVLKEGMSWLLTLSLHCVNKYMSQLVIGHVYYIYVYCIM